jgi:methyl-accepting chemotaxis protein
MSKVLKMVGSAVSALENISKPFNHETQMVAEQVERMYVGFQYQDRISQMMALLEGDIARLREAIEKQGEDLPHLTAWLADLESKYAMAEQHQDHHGAGSSATGDGANNETTFF